MEKEKRSENKEFIEEGLWKYEEAKATIVAFERSVKDILISILQEYRKKHEKWGRFTPDKDARIKNSTPGVDYAWQNAQVSGKVRMEDGKIKSDGVEIGIIWYLEHWPVYFVDYVLQDVTLIDPRPTPPVEVHKGRLTLRAKKNGLSIEQALLILLDEFAKVC